MSTHMALPARLSKPLAWYPHARVKKSASTLLSLRGSPPLSSLCLTSCREQLAGQDAADSPLDEQSRQLSESVAALGRRVDELASRQQAPVSERAVKHDVSLLVDAVQVSQAGSWNRDTVSVLRIWESGQHKDSSAVRRIQMALRAVCSTPADAREEDGAARGRRKGWQGSGGCAGGAEATRGRCHGCCCQGGALLAGPAGRLAALRALSWLHIA